MENSQYQELFFSESQEILVALGKALVLLEKKPKNQQCFDEIFRHCHTLKGMAATMDYEKIVKLAHAMENILDKVRKGKKPIEKEVVKFLFKGLDTLEALLEEIQNGKGSHVDSDPLVKDLEKILTTIDAEPSSKKKQVTEIQADNKQITSEQDNESETREVAAVNPTHEAHHLTSVRVGLDHLETLMNAIGELATNKIRLMEIAKSLGDRQLTDAIADMERVVGRLQDEAMQIRLIPLEYILKYFPRMVRDEASKEGKEVKLITEGSEIGMDRSVLDEINDPLIHILRNSISHGIETPAERERLGKPPEGIIKISVHRERNFVVLNVTDDGRGMDKEKIKAAILKEGKMTPEELAKMSDEDICMLVTLPGFSLSDKVTERAGRGVGMNVVRSKVEAIGGSLSIQSELGKGSTITLHIPLTMAIIRVMLMEVSNEVFAIPLANIAEAIKSEPSIIRHVDHQEVIPYRDGVLPLVRLQQKLGFNKNINDNGLLSIIVCEMFHKKIGLVVDKLLREEEVIVKNLFGYLRQMPVFSGATILGSGRVAMILDILHLID